MFRLIFGFCLKLKKNLWCVNEAFQIILIQRHKKFARLLFFLAACNKKFQRAKKMWQRLSRMEMIDPTNGWRPDKHGTHKHTHSSWILWSASHVCSKTMHSLFCITSWLPYITLCYIDSKIFSAPGTIMHGSIRLPPRSIACLWGCSLAINRMISIDPSSLTRKSLE